MFTYTSARMYVRVEKQDSVNKDEKRNCEMNNMQNTKNLAYKVLDKNITH